MLSAKQFASGVGRLADVKGERCDFAVVGARKCSAAGGSPSGSRAILGGAGFAIVLGGNPRPALAAADDGESTASPHFEIRQTNRPLRRHGARSLVRH